MFSLAVFTMLLIEFEISFFRAWKSLWHMAVWGRNLYNTTSFTVTKLFQSFFLTVSYAGLIKVTYWHFQIIFLKTYGNFLSPGPPCEYENFQTLLLPLFDLFSTKFSTCSCCSPHKSYFLVFEINFIPLKKKKKFIIDSLRPNIHKRYWYDGVDVSWNVRDSSGTGDSGYIVILNIRNPARNRECIL